MSLHKSERRTSVSIIICNFNCELYVVDAISSALGQVDVDIEVIVIDDQSTDRSAELIEMAAATDPRVRFLRTKQNLGPAGARNLGLAAARYEWTAVLDSDDLFHPERLRRLISFAEAEGVDIVADDLVIFDDTRLYPPRRLLEHRKYTRPVQLTVEHYVRTNCLYSNQPVLGYLKPVIRTQLIKTRGFKYNEDLRIGEDFDLILRMMASGLKFCVYPDLTYFYRKRFDSISHRLSESAIAKMEAADLEFRRDFPALSQEVLKALDERMLSLKRSQSFELLVDSIKSFDWRNAFYTLARCPSSAVLLRLPVQERIRRLVNRFRRKSATGVRGEGQNIAFISRQRIVGNTNGSSIYALSLTAHLKQKGFNVHYICPSPSVFGSWPILKLRPETDTFASISVRSGLKVGSYIWALELSVYARLAGRIIDIIVLKLKLRRRPLFGKAPYSIALPLTQDDALYIATEVPARADAILFDYAFLTACGPYALRPEAPSMVLMHDLFSSRKEQFVALGAKDSVAGLSFAEEVSMLSLADRVIAIQAQEGEAVAQAIGSEKVIVAPMAIQVSKVPYQGNVASLLFVGSNTAPNVDAIESFISYVWPLIRARRPEVTLDIVGSVSSAIASAPSGVELHGLVADLEPWYQKASVVISPLRVGSGLKIKLIEALAYGKAIVASSVTCQGVEELVSGSILVADGPEDQADAIVKLLSDHAFRRELSIKAWETAAEHFSAVKCYGPVGDYISLQLSGKTVDG